MQYNLLFTGALLVWCGTKMVNLTPRDVEVTLRNQQRVRNVSVVAHVDSGMASFYQVLNCLAIEKE